MLRIEKFNEQCRLSTAMHRYECVVGGVVVGRFSNTRTACWNAYLHSTHDVAVRDKLSVEHLNYHDCMIAVGKADLEREGEVVMQIRGRWRANG